MTLPIQQRGFSILELLIALGLGLMLTAGVVIVFVQNHRSAVQDEEIARVL
ncbi:MAG: prepilin-type N-terminal cleavage/methylation domain-containing protein, partial [Proteobacteria bacterium]|nr:prepilin-type N-terminal cleavage/methylation domain-containing protein [Pseudomonadota bacterium]